MLGVRGLFSAARSRDLSELGRMVRPNPKVPLRSIRRLPDFNFLRLWHLCCPIAPYLRAIQARP